MSVTTFPPIGDYAFLSNCEQSCLVAPDGSVEWMCLPRPDSPSVFGALLDRTAGAFRFGPANAQVPQNRRYVPGTMVLETTWQTPTGWLTVYDLLVMGPTSREQRRTDYHRAPADSGATGILLRLATCTSGRVEVLVNCAPIFNYGTAGGTWTYQGDGYDSMRVADATRRPGAQHQWHHPAWRTGRPLLRPHHDRGRRIGLHHLFLGGIHPSGYPGGGIRRAEPHHRLLAHLAEHGEDPRPSVENLSRPQRPHAERAQLRPHRRHHGGRDHLPAGNARRRAQLGLPVHLDQGLGVHAPGAVPPRFRLGSGRVLRLHHRRGQRR